MKLLKPAPKEIIEAYETIESTPRNTGFVGTPKGASLDNQKLFDRTDELPERKNLRGFQRIWVTARGLEAVLSRLLMTMDDLPALKGRRVLSIGEGASDFAKKLSTEHGIRAVGLDWWYGMSEAEMDARFVITEPSGDVLRPVGSAEARARLAPNRIAAQATALPIKDQSVARIYLSNVVYWYFAPTRRNGLGITDDAEGQRVIAEAARCIEVGGELRFDMTNVKEASALATILRDRFLDFSITTDQYVIIMKRLERIPAK